MKYQGQPTPGGAENLFYSLSAGALKSAHQSKVRLARPCILSSHKDEKSSAATLGESYDENGDTCCNTGLGLLSRLKSTRDNMYHTVVFIAFHFDKH